MDVEVLGIDHVYLSVRSLAVSESFYDVLLQDVLGYRKNHFALNGEPHVQYYNRQFGFVIRPARAGTPVHDSGTPGLHPFCLRVRDERAVDAVAAALGASGIEATAPRYYPVYAPDYYATFLVDPDGVRLEVTNFRANRRARMYAWDDAPGSAPGDAASCIAGSCLCGAIRYEAAGPPRAIGHCHCRTCRKAHGAAFSTIVPVEKAGFRWVAGEGLLAYFESSPGKRRWFCSRCGSQLVSTRAEREEVLLRAGCIDDGVVAPAVAHAWVDSMPAWDRIADDLPQFRHGFPGAPPGDESA